MQRRLKAVKISDQIILHHINVGIIYYAVRIDIGFGKMNFGFCLIVTFLIPLHKIDVKQLNLTVSVGISVQDFVLSKRRQNAQRNHGK